MGQKSFIRSEHDKYKLWASLHCSPSYWGESTSLPSAASRDTHLPSLLPQISQPHLPSPSPLLSSFLRFSLPPLGPPDDTGITQVMEFIFLCWSHWAPYLNPTFRLDLSMEYDLFISRYYRVWMWALRRRDHSSAEHTALSGVQGRLHLCVIQSSV